MCMTRACTACKFGNEIPGCPEPDEALVPARLVVEEETFDRIVDRVANPPEPTRELRELMRGQDG